MLFVKEFNFTWLKYYLIINMKAYVGEDEIDSIYPPNVAYCDVKGGFPGMGNLDADPLFVDPDNDDFHLLYDSPCRNTGTNTALELPDTDFEGDPRIANGTADIGADEFYTHLYFTGEAKPGGQILLKFIDLPSTSPVGFWLGSGKLDPPITSSFGDWYLSFPIFGPFLFAPIPSNGIEVLTGNLPVSPPGPYTLDMQALIGDKLTNHCSMFVE